MLLIFQKPKSLKGIGYILAGMGFLLLGIQYMKDGFDAFKSTLDLTRYSLPGFGGLLLYSLFGILATVIMQSSHATLVLTITALASGQISYDNALALAIGANIGTTVTAIIGSFSANEEGKRLALAHLVFNLITGAVAITRAFNPVIMTWAAGFAILLSFYGKTGALLGTIPTPVMGGIITLMFGAIAAIGMNTLVRSGEDLSETRNMIIISLVLVFGLGGMTLGIGEFSLKGIGLSAVVAILLNLVLPRRHDKSGLHTE
jgi:Na+/phosphate symporter